MNTTPSHTIQHSDRPISTLDFRDNKQMMLFSYGLRAVGAIIFSAIFYLMVGQVHPDTGLTLESLITIRVDGLPDIVSIALIIVAVVFVLWLHELIHASVFMAHTGAPPNIGMRGPMIFASAEGYMNSRNAMIINALAPFVVISVVGLLLMAIVPVSTLAWVFIPTVANAAAAGGDFMAVYWLLSLPRDAKIEDHGDVLVAYQPTA
ncbi:MAG: hypothetical protein CL607_08460 [Anaerolineaceae bacterium]|nr:hypothetical protein [Anaerolineaceae bacterium]